MIGIVGTIVLLPLALLALVYDLIRFAFAALVALLSAGVDRLATSR